MFNSYTFAAFFAVVFVSYVALRKRHRWQNRMLLAASYLFYGAWDWRFLFLLLGLTVLQYSCAIGIHNSKETREKRLFLILSVLGSLSVLGFFKYFNFFSTSLQSLLGQFGITAQPHLLHIALPVGLSFYTFQSMTYPVAIFRGRLKPEARLLDFALFIAFFPLLVAGPIERAERLLPQILSPRRLELDKFYEGCYLIFFGLFQKVVIADNLARVVDRVFGSAAPYSGALVVVASFAFTIQILMDFAGYSNIARGICRSMGFDVMVNFNMPYFATNPRQFWQRWHISLSSWLRDYLYIPLGGSRDGRLAEYRNLAITMVLGGLWHGAAWTFVVWGAYHGALLIIYRLLEPVFKAIPAPKKGLGERICFAIRLTFFFSLVSLGWLIFRAESMHQVFEMLRAVPNWSTWSASLSSYADALNSLIWIAPFVFIAAAFELLQYAKNDQMFLLRQHWAVKAVVYCVMLYLFLNLGVWGGKAFIYVRF